MNKEPRLRFTDEERSDPALEKPIRKAEKAAARADKAQANIPKKKVRQTVIDPDTGKKTSKLTFEDKKKPPSKLSQRVKEAPVHLVAGKLHKEIRETEQDNVGVESAHKSEEAVETGAYLVREGYRSHKLKPYRKAAQAERQLEKANVNVLYQKSLQENPQFSSNPLSRWQQKQAIKKQYAAAKRTGQTAGNTAQAASKTGKAARTVKEKAQQAGAFVMRHKKGFLIAGVLFLIACMLMNTMSSCSMMAQSIGSVLSGTTYPSDDPEMLAVEADYAAREAQLQEKIDNIESSHPGYDEYRYDLGMIGHDPHELAAFLSAVLQGYTRQSAQAELARVFAAQYQLTLTEEVEIRYARWAKVFNLKQMAQTMNYLSENNLLEYAILEEKAAAATAHHNELSAQIKAAEKRMAEIAVLRTHIVNYAKTREVYVAYRKAGYSKKFREEHEEEILLHQAAKNAFDEMGIKKLPKVKELQTEYAKLLEEKKKTYAEYRRSREEMRELLTAKANVDRVLKMEVEQDVEKEKDHGQR